MELFLPLLWICAVSHISFNHSPSTTSKPHIPSEGDRSLIFCHSTQEQTREQTQIRCKNVFFLLATGLLEKCSILKLVRDFSPATGCGSEAWAKDIYGERSFCWSAAFVSWLSAEGITHLTIQTHWLTGGFGAAMFKEGVASHWMLFAQIWI